MVDRHRAARASERGDIIGSWLLQIALFLTVIAFVGHELIAVVVTSVSLDDAAREVARAARDEYRVSRSIEQATTAATQTAVNHDARIAGLMEDGDELVVELERDAPTVVIHRIGVLQELTVVNTSARVSWAS